jgi:beta-glucosidase-like glycosyl hydrolase
LAPISPAGAVLEPGLTGLVEQTATESIVLLENQNNILPLTPSRTVSVFGRIQVDYFPNGFGSGGDVKYTYATNPLTAMRRNPGITVNEDLATIYEKWCRDHAPDKGGWATWPRSYPEMPLSDATVADAADNSDVALVFIGRSLGESMEQMNGKGGFLLTDAERAMLAKVNAQFPNVIVAINAGNQIDMSWVGDYANIKAMLAVWQGGQEAGYSLARVLAGDESPSGKLPDTWAYELTDYPSTGQFGYGVTNPIYQEDIFVGYRYFETFAQDRVLYPFGYGLSYTTFDIQPGTIASSAGRINVPVTVTNTGSRSGKEVVQVYVGAPQGQLGKSARSLLAFAKTGLLAPGEAETLTLSFKVSEMASYDDAGKTGHKSAWVLEPGTYSFYVGNSVKAPRAGTYTQAALEVTQQAVETLAPLNTFNRWHAQDDGNGGIELVTDDPVPSTTNAIVADRMAAAIAAVPEFTQTGVDEGIKLIDVYNDPSRMNDFVAQMSLQELAWLTTGAGTMDAPTSVLGSAGVYGGYIPELAKYGIPSLTLTDGPSGIRISESATQLSIGTALAATWNTKLVEDLYAGVGKEMIRNGSTALLAPGMDMHRNPLGGRNFEYFSEDPLLTGAMGGAFIRGLEGVGAGATPKHFALNEQETARGNGNSQVSERAQREIYLKAFEVALKESNPTHLMTAYNQIANHYCNRNWQLTTSILRDEWGFDGLVMSDWGGVGGGSDATGLTSGPARLRAGMNLLEQGSPGDTTILNSINHVGNAPSSGLWLRLGELQQNVITILNVAMKTTKFRDEHSLPRHDYATGEYAPVTDQFFSVARTAQTSPRLTGIALDGTPLADFVPSNVDYSVFTPADAALPAVSATAATGVSVSVTQPTSAKPSSDIVATTADGGRTLYRLYFDDAADRPVFHSSDQSAELVGIDVNGVEVSTFYPNTFDYVVWVDDADSAVVTATAKPGVTVTSTKIAGTNDWEVRAESATRAHVYTVALGDIDETKLPSSDPLTGTSLDPKWSVTGPASAYLSATTDGLVNRTRPSEWQIFGVDNIRNLVWQPAQGNWTATVKATVSAPPSQLGQSFGMVLFDDLSGSYVKNSVAYVQNQLTAVGAGNPATGSWYHTTNGFNGLYAYATAGNSTTIYFRFVKNGESIQASTSTNGTTFTNRGSGNALNTFLSDPKIGLFATQAQGNNQLTVTFSDFTVTNATPAAFPAVRETVVTPGGESKLFADSRFASRGNLAAGQGGGDTWAAGGHTMFASGEFNHSLYNIDVEQAGYYTLTPRTYSAVNRYSKWGFDLHVDGAFVHHYEGVGAKAWGPMEPGQRIYLTAGRHKVRIGCWTTTGFQLSGLSIAMAGTAANREALAVIVRGYEMIAAQASLYTPESYADFAAAWADAQAALAGTEVSDYALVAIPAALEAASAPGKLVFAVDYSALQALIGVAQTRLADRDSYLGVPALEAAVAHAEALIASGTATELDVAGEVAALMTALANAVPKGDKTVLAAVIAAVEAMDSGRYTPATWADVAAALVLANAVNAKAEVSADEVTEAVGALDQALSNLATRAAKAGLASAIAVARTILGDAASYVPASVIGLAEETAEAQGVYDDPNATQAQVAQAQTDLIAVLANVRIKPISPSPSGAAVLASSGTAIPVSVALSAAIDPAAVAAEVGTPSPGAPVVSAFVKAPKPKIVGTRKVGRTLKAKVGAWSPAPTFSYQWYRGGKAIAKATSSTYKVKAADRGKRITVTVKAARAGYATIVKASAKTAKIK